MFISLYDLSVSGLKTIRTDVPGILSDFVGDCKAPLRERADQLISGGVTNREAPTDEELAEHNLRQKPKNEWSVGMEV